jgi:predicted TIM-barrel fold metal-dependent hydrolase
MHNGMFIFDNVVHMYDNTAGNVIDPLAMNYQVGMRRRMPKLAIDPEGLKGRKVEVEEAVEYLFKIAPTDMAVAQTVPLYSYWEDGFAPAPLQYALKQAVPDRVVYCGAVDPIFHGLRGSIKELERQRHEWGAISFKFYQAHKGGLHWSASDRLIAYPLFEKCQELGINHIQFHKGVPLGQEFVEHLRPNDLQRAAMDFPDLTFIIHHFGVPYVDETINIASRFENVWLSLSFIINMIPLSPWTVYDAVGKALLQVGADRILYGSESFLWPDPRAYIESFAALEIPDDLQDRYGYPQITESMRKKMFGLNQAKLLGIDVEAKLKQLYPDIDPKVAAAAAVA